MSSGRRNSVKAGTIVKIVIGVAILAVVIFVGMKVLRKKVDDQFASEEESSVESAEVTTGSISTTVAGSGTLAYEDSEDITLPSTVEITNYYVSKGDNVEEGDLLASVNTTTLISAMNDIQTEIDQLDENLSDVADETIEDEIDATVDGRVKKIYVASDDDVATVMYENNALMLLSLDGEMAVDVVTDALAEGDTVTVKSGDVSYDGTVEKVLAGTATVTLTDDGPVYDADAEVFSGETSVGNGKIYIHKSLSVTGYAGTVSEVEVSENQEVEAGDQLMSLTDTTYTANYDSLLSQREDLEEELQNLVTIYKEGAVYAKAAGTVVSLTKGSTGSSTAGSSTSASSSAGLSASSGDTASAGFSFGSTGSTSTTASSGTSGTDTVFSISPNTNMNITVSVDESDILSISVGQEATVTCDSLEDQTFTGTVTEINTEGSSSNGVTTYSAVISVPRDANMLAGMSADVTITIEGVDNALLIPEAALNKTSSTAYVYTSYNEETDTLGDMVEVTIGISNGNYVEIIDGLSEGDTVYYTDTDEDSFDFGGFSGFGGGGMSDFGGWSGGSMPGTGSSSGSGSSSGRSGGNSSGGGMPGGMSMPGGN